MLVFVLAGASVAQAQTEETLTGVVTDKTTDGTSYTLEVEVEAEGVITLYVLNVEEETYNTVDIGDIITFTGSAEADDPLTEDIIEFDAASVEITGIQVTGTVVSCSDITGIIVIDIDGDAGDEEVSLQLPEGTSCADYPVGETVTIGGEEDVQEVKNDFDATRGYYCTDAEATHPMVARLATRYGVSEAKIAGWFCNGFGFGEIMLALQTATRTGATADEYLAERGSGLGWGQIWRLDSLVTSESDALPPGQAKKADPAIAPGNSGNAPGQNRSEEEDCPGNSCNAPGQNRTGEEDDSTTSLDTNTDSCPGNSCNAPGRSDNGNGNSNGNNGNNGKGNGNNK